MSGYFIIIMITVIITVILGVTFIIEGIRTY